eukprot:jgi/Botrbrau1/18329/Bobra.0179s0056.1
MALPPPPSVSPFRTDLLAGQVALVTGGSSGIGLEIVRQLGLHGAKVAITGRRQGILDEAVKYLQKDGIVAVGFPGDVRKTEDAERWVRDTVAALGRLDILVNCAAGNFLATAEELSTNGFRTVMEIDAIGTFNVSRAAFPQLKQSPNASIINVSATLQYGATFWQAHASAAKSAVDSLTRSMALEWGHYGIRVNGIAPGGIAGTAGFAKLAGLEGVSDEEALKVAAEVVPLGKIGTRWDIGMAVVYLVGAAGRYVSGHVLVVDGAAWIYRPTWIARESVSRVSRGVEGRSRSTGTANSKL